MARGYDMPMLLRFEDILESQIIQMHESFRSAIAKFDYKGEFKGVYPIKVNQQKQVIETITRIGKFYHHGLEAGSKAELIAALSFLDDKEACLVCNGYKDREFIDLGLYACKMGFKCFFVLEMPGELDLILERSKALGIKPLLGVRLKLSTQAGGHWTESGGDRSIFGLTISQIIEAIEKLKKVRHAGLPPASPLSSGFPDSQYPGYPGLHPGSLPGVCRTCASKAPPWAISIWAADLPWIMTAPTPIT